LSAVEHVPGKKAVMTIPSATSAWAGLLFLSVVADAGATAYLKLAGDRIDGLSFLWAATIGVVVFAPSIVLFGFALKSGPSYFATVGVWAVGVYAANAIVGVAVFGDPFGSRTALGIAAACLAVVLLNPA
jgi:multidrug transporter EmrE-like cation transporter